MSRGFFIISSNSIPQAGAWLTHFELFVVMSNFFSWIGGGSLSIQSNNIPNPIPINDVTDCYRWIYYFLRISDNDHRLFSVLPMLGDRH